MNIKRRIKGRMAGVLRRRRLFKMIIEIRMIKGLIIWNDFEKLLRYYYFSTNSQNF